MKITATMFNHPIFKQTLPLGVALLLATLSMGQSVCTYTINMFDSFGDGWSGGQLTVVSDGNTTTHTLATGAQGSSNFQVTSGASVVISWTPGSWPFEPSFELLNPDGVVLYSSGSPIQTGVVYDADGNCPNCPAPSANLITVPTNQITENSAFINWQNQSIAEYWVVQYGPAGFPIGTGITLQTTSSDITLTGLNPGVEYDVYISTYCGVDSTSSWVGPESFTTDYNPTPNPNTCEYTFNLSDSFGDGWNGCFLEVTHNGQTYNYTIDFTQATTATYTLTASSNFPIVVNFVPGSFLNEVSYEIIDPDGNTIFADGPFPQVGEVLNIIACPTCPGPIDAWMSDVNATNARLSWQPSPNASSGNYIIEYGSMGFTLGTGIADTIPVGQLSYAQLTGLAENTWYNAYIKLDCGTEFSRSIGPLIFKTIWLDDLSVSNILSPASNDCDLSEDEVITIALTNYGQTPQTLFEFYYAVNGQVAPIPVPQDGLFTGVIGNDSTQIIQFETTWDFSEPGIYHIQAWIVLDGDSQTKNDTFETFVITAYPKPMQEDFEDNLLPTTWNSTGFIYAPFSHNNDSYVLGRNLYSFSPFVQLTTHTVGPITAGDQLKFDYRYVDYFDGLDSTILDPGDKLEVQISDDCQDTWQTVLTIDANNHTASTSFATKTIPLTPYEGEAISVRFLGTWGEGDYWLDLDNINIAGCPEALFIVGDVGGSLEGDSTGSVDLSVPFDQGPFTYAWEDAAGNDVSTDEDLDGVPPGTYTVTVTSAGGCTGIQTFIVGIFTGTDEAEGLQEITLYPNPTAGAAFVDVKLLKNMDVQLRLLNMSGQTIFVSELENANRINQEIDLSNQAPGMYILQVMANGKPYHAKLMVAR